MRARTFPKACLIVGLVTAALYFGRLGRIPLVESSEGFHVAIAHEMVTRGDWITPHFDGIRYFEKPPLFYWLTAAAFSLVGLSEWAARFWQALAVVGTAMLTAWLGARVGGERLGLIAGLAFAVNVEVFLFGRLAKPDLLFVFFIVLSFAGFAVAWRDRSRRALLVGWAGLGLAAMTKDVLGALGPLAVFVLFFVFARERFSVSRWMPLSGVALLALIVVPWHAAMEWLNPGFLWYMAVDNHVLTLAGRRLYPDEDVSLGALEFFAVTAAGFFPWSLAVPWVLPRLVRESWRNRDTQDRDAKTWLLFGLWGVGFLLTLTLSPMRLPHYGLSAFPALALLVAKVWDDALAGKPGAPSARMLLAAPFVVLCVLAAVSLVGWAGTALLPSDTLSSVDLYSRNVSARGQAPRFIPVNEIHRLMLLPALTFAAGTLGVGVALWRGLPQFGLGVLFATTAMFLPVTSDGLAALATIRSPRPVTDLVRKTVGPNDVVIHEGPLENTGSLTSALVHPVKVVRGSLSNLAFGSTFPEARDTFWDDATLRQAWTGPKRLLLVSIVEPERSIVRDLPPGSVHLLLETGGRWLYSNRVEDRALTRAAPSPRAPDGASR